MNKHAETLKLLSKEGDIIESISDKFEHFDSLKWLHSEGFINGKRSVTDTSDAFWHVSITQAGIEYIARYKKSNAPWYKKLFYWDTFERLMKTTKFIYWFVFVMGVAILNYANS
ncbi:hypothetical protein [Shewanella holmiensis]|uniref:Uncharacterized protein n=1 Tax=Shewanella holmiensis TaxID=2952222 RepID=A0A9X2WPE8_9GAMM|nr:hypothetical protein [Shewanella holmiensis]MCT7942627.1 hypothetical protein [Shewanella holmiensis]